MVKFIINRGRGRPRALYHKILFVQRFKVVQFYIFSLIIINLVNGGWARWSDWGYCSVTCGDGFQSRERTCTNPAPVNDGDPCQGVNEQKKFCITSPCPSKTFNYICYYFIIIIVLFLTIFNIYTCLFAYQKQKQYIFMKHKLNF